jgi:hypothetical protein
MARKRHEDQSYFVIAASPLPQSGYGGKGLYYDQKGEIISDKCKAATFITWEDAKEFADSHGIKLNGVPYIAKVWFLESEVERPHQYRDSDR